MTLIELYGMLLICILGSAVSFAATLKALVKGRLFLTGLAFSIGFVNLFAIQLFMDMIAYV